MKLVAVMQPTFIPWIGYFALLDAVDVFIFLDKVQFTKPSWQMRNFMRGPNGPVLISLNIQRKPSKPLICDTHLANNGFEVKLLKKIEMLIKTKPFSDHAMNILSEAFLTCEGKLSVLNRTIINKIASAVGIHTPTHLESELPVRETEKSMRILKITEHFNGSCYLSPIGSKEYLQVSNPFAKSDVSLRFFNYVHPSYPQGKEGFLSHMSALEAFATVGPDKFLSLIRQGVNPPLAIQELSDGTNEKI